MANNKNLPSGAKSAGGQLSKPFKPNSGNVRKANPTGSSTRQGMVAKKMKKGC